MDTHQPLRGSVVDIQTFGSRVEAIFPSDDGVCQPRRDRALRAIGSGGNTGAVALIAVNLPSNCRVSDVRVGPLLPLRLRGGCDSRSPSFVLEGGL